MRDYKLVIDYCACMVAIALSRHRVDSDNIGIQYSAEELSSQLNLLPYSDGPNFNVNSLALKHGFQLFSGYLRKIGIDLIPMYEKDKYLVALFELESCQRSTEIKFSTFSSLSIIDTEATVLLSVINIRDRILQISHYPLSPHPSPSSVFGALHYSAIVEMNKPKVIIVPKIITRKSPNELSDRAINNSANKIILNAETRFGLDHSLFYLESAVKRAKKRKLKLIATQQNDVANDDDKSDSEDDDGAEDDALENLGAGELIYDRRILIALSNIPAKHVKFAESDKTNVCALYTVVKVVAAERDYKNLKVAAAIATREILQNNSYYANITTRTIIRWAASEKSASVRPGRKINDEFGNEVRGNLMLCIFEKNEIEVD